MNTPVYPRRTASPTSAWPPSSTARHAAARRRVPAAFHAIRAFIFDVDGVLADTAELHAAAWRRLAEELNLPVLDGLTDAVRGLSRRDAIEKILDGRPVAPQALDEMMARKNGFYLAALAQLGPDSVLPGAARLIDDLRALGLKLAAASVSRNARTVLRQLEIIDAFDAVIDGNDVAAARAGLNQFALAAAALRVAPDRCVVVEDSPTGIASARQLGMKTLGVGDHRRLSAAGVVFESLEGVAAAPLLRRLTPIH